jgi:hypothetical protein
MQLIDRHRYSQHKLTALIRWVGHGWRRCLPFADALDEPIAIDLVRYRGEVRNTV